MQRTIDGCGLDPVVPSARLANDEVVCEDGWICKHSEAHYDCEGRAWGEAVTRHDADVETVSDILDGVDKWVCECAQQDDYASGYIHIVDEVSHEWPERVREWIEGRYGDWLGHTDFDAEPVIAKVCEELDGEFECDVEYTSNEYAAYNGKGCCLWAFDIGECEEQVEIDNYPELKVLHDAGRLDDVLDDVNCNAYVSRSCRRVKNEETGYYENAGRETYMPYAHNKDHPDITTCHMPGGQWMFVVDAERMEELVREALRGGSNSDAPT